MRLIISLLIAISLITAPTHPTAADIFLTSKVKDISDRKYEKAVIELLDNAKDSIVISMYFINLSQEPSPANLMLNDLLEARQRGVDVTIYLNTKHYDPKVDKDFFVQNPTIKKLKSAGCLIYLMPSQRKLHDKLIIVDNRYIVEGSTNWSIKGLRRNFESSTLIDSPDLAKIKLDRLKEFIRLIEAEQESTYTPYYLKNTPTHLQLPNKLLLDSQYLARMVTKKDNRAFDLYVLLLAHSQLTGKEEFFLNMEDMGLSLGLPASWSPTALRRQVIKALRKLKLRYNLIDVDFFHSKNAYVSLCHPERSEGSSVFAIPSSTIINPGLSLRVKFYLIVQAYLEEQGEEINTISNRALARRFGVSEYIFRQVRKDIKQRK